MEYGEFALPRPQLVILLDAPVALARRLVGRKAARGYTTLEADIHEADAAHSGATREVYLELADRDGWQVVSTADDDGAVRDVDDIAAEIWARRGAVAPVTFAAVAEQHEAKRLLSAALAEGPAHAYLLHGPPGVGKRAVALLFAAELLGDHARVERRTHPDLYVLEPVGDQIRIDDIRTLRRTCTCGRTRRRDASI